MSKLILAQTSDECLENFRKNAARNWPQKDIDAMRLYPMAQPSFTRSFKFKLDDSVFAIGSCFARNMELHLSEIGGNVTSTGFEFELKEDDRDEYQKANQFNKYSIHSVYNDLKWALDRNSFDPKRLLIVHSKNKSIDLQLGQPLVHCGMEEMIKFKDAYLDHMAKVVEADVVILTLGYVETWYDKEAEVYLNVMPPLRMIKNQPNRFEFRVLAYEEVLEMLFKVHDLLQKYRKKPLKMLLTVSPVPLKTTFRKMDILTANTYSKSVQRAAVDQFVSEAEGVDYVPSFESVSLSSPDVVWRWNDFRHVRTKAVKAIMSRVIDEYVKLPDERTSANHSLYTESNNFLPIARKLLESKNSKDFLEFMKANREKSYEFPWLLLEEAQLLTDVTELDDHIQRLTELIEVFTEKPLLVEALIHILFKKQDKSGLEKYVKLHSEKFPKRSRVELKK